MKITRPPRSAYPLVSPAKAGVHVAVARSARGIGTPRQLRKRSEAADKWVPAFAGKTRENSCINWGCNFPRVLRTPEGLFRSPQALTRMKMAGEGA